MFWNSHRYGGGRHGRVYREICRKDARVISGFDRLVFRGTLRAIRYAEETKAYLIRKGVWVGDFAQHVQAVSERLKESSLAEARKLGRKVLYLASSKIDKDAVARRIAARQEITRGLVCVLSCVEPCRSFEVYRDREAKQLKLVSRLRKCLFLYHYAIHPVFGFMNDVKHRVEGVRVKHTLNGNSVKAYEKAFTVGGNMFRVETTLNQEVEGFRVYRPKQGGAEDDLDWRPMRRGVADLHRRAEVSQKANERYLQALASLDDSTRLEELIEQLSQPKLWKGRRVRGLRPWEPIDSRLLAAISRGEFTLNGLRNRDLQRLLFEVPASAPQQARQRSAKVSRLLRLLRAHGLLNKVPRTHRYQVTAPGRKALTAILAARHATIAQLTKAA